jgi:predicted NBD/HSP70 family sugar kinase
MGLADVVRPETARRTNRAIVLEHIHQHGELARADLTQLLGLNRSTIASVIADLVGLGLVSERVPARSDGVGRPSHLVGPRSDGPYVIAVEIDADHVTTSAVGLGGDVLSRDDHDLRPQDTGATAVADRILADAATIARDVPAGAFLVGVGVSLPGTVRSGDEVVVQAPNLGWRDEPFHELLASRFPPGLPIRLANDADVGAMAEQLRGAASGASDAIYLIGKIGVGAGMIVGGKALTGAGGLAGEVGHMVLDPAGPVCRCGSNGCMEALVGEAALLRASGWLRPPTRHAVAQIVEAARLGEPAARAGIAQVGSALGLAIANLVNLLNPEVVILGGSLAPILELGATSIEAQLDRHAMAGSRRMVTLRTPGLGDDSSLIGAAELAFRPLLADPYGTVQRRPA